MLTYIEEGHRWNFEKYVTAMKKHHQILEGLVLYGYSGIDEHTKVRYLLDGIKTNKLEASKSTILFETRYQNDFDGCVTSIKSFLKQKAVHDALTCSVSQVSKTGDVASVKDHYYSKEECNKLTNEQKEALCQKQAKCRHKPGSQSIKVLPGQATKKQKTDKSYKAVSHSISAITKKLEMITTKLEGKGVPDVVSTDGSSNQESGMNHTNAALSRQKGLMTP
jgi:hypothetical protein